MNIHSRKYFKAASSFLLLILVSLSIFSCSSPKQLVEKQIDGTPAWFMSPPSDTDQYLYSTGSAISTRRNVATTRAMLAANQNLAVRLGAVVENMQEEFFEEITSGERSNYLDAFTNATRQITNQELIGVNRETIEFVAQIDGRIEAFVLAKMPVGEARSILINALSVDEEMYTRLQKSNVFERMDDALRRKND